MRVGVPREYFFDDLDAEVAAAMDHALRGIAESRWRRSGKCGSTCLPTVRCKRPSRMRITRRSVAKSPELYQAETVRRIRSGEKVSAVEYIQRRRELEQARRSIGRVFADVDVLVTPTTPVPAAVIADLQANPEALRPAELRLLRNTRPFNVWGLPAISVPCGFTQSGLPIGLQIAGAHWREDLVLRVAHAYEQATAWHKRKIPL